MDEQEKKTQINEILHKSRLKGLEESLEFLIKIDEVMKSIADSMERIAGIDPRERKEAHNKYKPCNVHYDGCHMCKYTDRREDEEPCILCKHNFLDLYVPKFDESKKIDESEEEERRRLCRENYARQLDMLGYDVDGNPKR